MLTYLWLQRLHYVILSLKFTISQSLWASVECYGETILIDGGPILEVTCIQWYDGDIFLYQVPQEIWGTLEAKYLFMLPNHARNDT